ncbi:hypothetical protein ACLOJK_028446, partial [Asimina triloba]
LTMPYWWNLGNTVNEPSNGRLEQPNVGSGHARNDTFGANPPSTFDDKPSYILEFTWLFYLSHLSEIEDMLKASLLYF